MVLCIAMPDTPELIPSAEACERLRIDRSTLSRWVALGKITPALQGPGATGAMWFTERSVADLHTQMQAAS